MPTRTLQQIIGPKRQARLKTAMRRLVGRPDLQDLAIAAAEKIADANAERAKSTKRRAPSPPAQTA